MQFAIDQAAQAQREQDQQALHTKERIAQPIPLLSFAQHDLPADHGHAQQTEADHIEGLASIPTPARSACKYSGSWTSAWHMKKANSPTGTFR